MLVPRRADGGPRDRVWEWVRSELERAWPWPIFEGHHDVGEGEWNQPVACNRAAEAAGDWDFAVITDADVIAPGWGAAVDAVIDNGGIAMPHTEYKYLSEAGTESILAGDDVPRDELVEWSQPFLCIANLVVSRGLWERVGGQDERFAGHDHSDVAFYYACRGLIGEEARVAGPLWHLWHPINLETPRINWEMVAEYKAALEANRMESFLAGRR